MRRGYDVHVQDSFFRVRGNYYVMFLLHKKRSALFCMGKCAFNLTNSYRVVYINKLEIHF